MRLILRNLVVSVALVFPMGASAQFGDLLNKMKKEFDKGASQGAQTQAQSRATDSDKFKTEFVGNWSANCDNRENTLVTAWSLNGDRLSTTVDRFKNGTKTPFSRQIVTNIEVLDATKGRVRVKTDYDNLERNTKSTR